MRFWCVISVSALCITCAAAPSASADTYQQYGSLAVSTLLHTFYHAGYWRSCSKGCDEGNQDWGSDSLTYTLFLHWKVTHDPSDIPYFRELTKTTPLYRSCKGIGCRQWSDVPEWDAVAASLDYVVTGEAIALAKAKAAYRSVEESDAYGRGACPSIRYQRPFGTGGGLKTLETEANAIRAGLLLYRSTRSTRYLATAMQRYAAARRYFLDPRVPLYSVYVFDNGVRCTQLPGRFFGSVNGLMIDNGIMLSHITGKQTYREQALQTSTAVGQNLSDPNGVYEDLQAENDIVEPLVESMYDLAVGGITSSREWILRNAQTAISDRSSSGYYGRFFGGPPPSSIVTAWQSNGGLALFIAAAALNPHGTLSAQNAWTNARFIAKSITTLPASIHFVGSRIALLGTLGEFCCEAGHARVFVDGVETFDGTGIWQNKSVSGRALPNAVLFAWQWPAKRAHTLTLYPGVFNRKEGGSFLHLRGYLVK